MNVNDSSYAALYSNASQTAVQSPKSGDVSVRPQNAVPNEPSKEATPVQESSESNVGRKIDVYV